ncbi:hypothetical protein DSL64_04080 [Dyadobacter luteus]|jgi:hypothetical protein|uniref:TerB family tellurite resistance protein n=1 Tax=Dyadobacter luteus TaxID=2259619 RepID=A0A3D8YGX1_9BACT|nr:hypothetical protein [Dyadobacter luteus]REA63626.1 hypothetical protein DSL64_04080 [Dyadobacter luteus]
MGKIIATLVLALLSCSGCCAQRLAEWLNQNKTQKEYLIEQVAHLKLYLELTQKGYQLAKQGLTMIGDIKRGELALHKNRFDSLLIVSGQVGSHPGLVELTKMHGRINQICAQLTGQLASEQVLTQQQLDYIDQVLGVVYDDCQGIIYGMFAVIRSGNLSMSDQGRIKRIDALLARMQDNYLFTESFAEQARLLASEVAKEKTEIENSRVLHGIK